jgi:hypothetical protein
VSCCPSCLNSPHVISPPSTPSPPRTANHDLKTSDHSSRPLRLRR